MRTSSLAVLSLATAVIGCGSPETRSISGQIATNSYSVNHAVVVAQSSDHRVWVAPVAANGRFTLTVPPNVEYRITLANTTAKPGVYSAVARINWPTTSGAQRWAHIGAAAVLNLGPIYKRGTKAGAVSGASTSGGECKEDDGAKTESTGKEDDCDCGNKTDDHDKCDKDDDGDRHDHECDKDDQDKGDHGDGDHGDDDGHECDGGAGGGSGTGGGGAGG
ncbi:MAG: hypothetical protein JWN44_5805, partial [Myxococcales bacterium]|nr:hypothetical protein [Myxococcales bacterium]